MAIKRELKLDGPYKIFGVHPVQTPRGGGVLDIFLGGEVLLGPSNQTLTLFKTKLVRFLIPCLRHLAQNYTLFKKFAK